MFILFAYCTCIATGCTFSMLVKKKEKEKVFKRIYVLEFEPPVLVMSEVFEVSVADDKPRK